jgi:hypothetical protein
MSRFLVPPRAGEQISNTKSRVHDLERRLSRAIPERIGYVAKFSLHGGLYEVESGIELHPGGGKLQLVYAVLVEPGSTRTVLSLTKNGTEFSQLILPATVDYNEQVVSLQFAARTDRLQVVVAEAGTGAETLTVYGLFDR